jgi:hypothetical protein
MLTFRKGVKDMPTQLTTLGAPEKYIKDGQVAIIHSTAYYNDSGWYTLHGLYNLIFDRNVVEFILKPYNPDIVLDYCQRKYGMDNDFSGIPNLSIVWLPENTLFFFNEYCGREYIISMDDAEKVSIRA